MLSQSPKQAFQLTFWPMEAAHQEGHLALRDEGGATVRVDMYTGDMSHLFIDVPRDRLLLYVKRFLEAGLRSG